MITIPKNFSKRNTEAFYITQYVKYYIEHKSEITGKSMGEIVEEALMSNKDFKAVMNEFFESSKL
jgi:hypothetical protein